MQKLLLLLGAFVASLACIVLQNNHVLPLDVPTFTFFSLVLFLFALYRPSWVFLLFVSMLPFELTNLLPASLGVNVMLRPYQWIMLILFFAVLIRLAAKRLPFRIFELRVFDLLPLLPILGSFMAVSGAPLPGVALKQALVVTSFVAIYFLGRIFFRTVYDARQALPFFLLPSAIVFGYALWQNIHFLQGQESFEVMAGRPNATFSEADWLGLYILVILALLYTLLSLFLSSRRDNNVPSEKTKWGVGIVFVMSGIVISYIVLLLSVARSAWLGAVMMTGVFILALLFEHGRMVTRHSFNKSALFTLSLTVAFACAVFFVMSIPLTSFQLLNRGVSTVSGLQKITVSCVSADTALPQKITDESELTINGCRHILLEEVSAEVVAGNSIHEVYRPDPNVSVRRHIYGVVGEILKKHSLLGIGWGNASFFLGADERGAGLNASNMFLEVWLGSGVIGFLSFVLLWFLVVIRSIAWYCDTEEREERLFALFLFTTLVSVTIFNLFNSGILLGFFFFFLSLSTLALERGAGFWSKKIL